MENISNQKISIFDTAWVKEHLTQNKLQPFRLKQINQEIYKNSVMNFEDMTTLSKDLRQNLTQNIQIDFLTVDKVLENEETTKIAFKTHDDLIIETVLMYHWNKHTDWKLNRVTICISSQVGCPVGCTFCVTWKLGLKRNLTADEMIYQLLWANNYLKNKLGKKEDWSDWKVRNVVFMGMWEPLLNYNHLKTTIVAMLDQEKFSLSKRHVTISTSWIIPWIKKLIEDNIPVGLAISLHSPNQILRQHLIPIGEHYNLEKLMAVLEDYIQASWNRIFYEYIMIKDVTDKNELAHELWELLKNQLCHINLIPYNENPAIDYQQSSNNQIRRFQAILEEYGCTVTVRDTLGRKVKWACWQLWYEKLKQKLNA